MDNNLRIFRGIYIEGRPSDPEHDYKLHLSNVGRHTNLSKVPAVSPHSQHILNFTDISPSPQQFQN